MHSPQDRVKIQPLYVEVLQEVDEEGLEEVSLFFIRYTIEIELECYDEWTTLVTLNRVSVKGGDRGRVPERGI